MREKLAALAHEQWSGWMRYLFGKGTFNDDGTWTMPAWAVVRWERQMTTPYSELSENERESDRKEADRVLIISREDQVPKTKNDGENICVNCGTVMVRARIEVEGGWILAWLCECGEDVGSETSDESYDLDAQGQAIRNFNRAIQAVGPVLDSI